MSDVAKKIQEHPFLKYRIKQLDGIVASKNQEIKRLEKKVKELQDLIHQEPELDILDEEPLEFP